MNFMLYGLQKVLENFKSVSTSITLHKYPVLKYVTHVLSAAALYVNFTGMAVH